MLHLHSTLPLVLALASFACGCARDPASPVYNPLTLSRMWRNLLAAAVSIENAT
jgi:hypothetical protein